MQYFFSALGVARNNFYFCLQVMLEELLRMRYILIKVLRHKKGGVYMRLGYSACSHIGSVRKNNEDNLYVPGRIIPYEYSDAVFVDVGECCTPSVFAVCDGMGGQECGEYASYVAAYNLAELELAIKTEPPERIDRLVQDYVTKVNERICKKMQEKSLQIGTTLALVVITSDEIRAYNIGDSRIYALTNDKLLQVSEDHNMTTQKIDMGILTKEQAFLDPDRNKLTRYLGNDETVLEVERLPPLELYPHLPILLASDGLSELVSEAKIKEVLQNSKTKDAAELLVIAALEKGGRDNVTCVVINAS